MTFMLLQSRMSRPVTKASETVFLLATAMLAVPGTIVTQGSCGLLNEDLRFSRLPRCLCLWKTNRGHRKLQSCNYCSMQYKSQARCQTPKLQSHDQRVAETVRTMRITHIHSAHCYFEWLLSEWS